MHSIDLIERTFPGRRSDLKRIILREALACFNEVGIEATSSKPFARAATPAWALSITTSAIKKGWSLRCSLRRWRTRPVWCDHYLQAADTAHAGVVGLGTATLNG